jgi:hypothetical protein
VIASLISASRIAQEAARFVSCSTKFRCSHISWAKSHNSITVLHTHTCPLSLSSARCRFADTANRQCLLK